MTSLSLETLSLLFYPFLYFGLREKELNLKELDIPHYCATLRAIYPCQRLVCEKERERKCVSVEMCVSSR